MIKLQSLLICLVSSLLLVSIERTSAQADDESKVQRLLYVASPGIRNYLEYGGHGLLVFDIDNEHRFVRRIKTGGLNSKGEPINVKGVCASAETGRIYISTLTQLLCLDLHSDELLWEREEIYDGGCDRMSISPDGKLIYLPTLEKDHWKVIDAMSGDVIKKVITNSGSHNTIYGQDGKQVYMAGLKSPILKVAETTNHTVVKEVGPFSHNVRPFTINADQSLVFVNINGLIGFEVGDLKTGKKLHRVEVEGFKQGIVKRHGCPSHGIGMTPDGAELWVSDGANSHLHIFDATVMPPKQKESIQLRDQPGWVTFTIRGDLAYPSTGEVIDVKTRKIVAQLIDEDGRKVQSEKLLEIDFQDGKVVACGDQFGYGRP